MPGYYRAVPPGQKPPAHSAHCDMPTPADPNSRLTIWVYRWPSSWSNCRASRKAATGSRSYAVRRASFSQYETLGSERISLRFILTFTARVSINLDTDSASSRNRYLLQSSSLRPRSLNKYPLGQSSLVPVPLHQLENITFGITEKDEPTAGDNRIKINHPIWFDAVAS